VVLGDAVKEDAGLVHANVYGADGRVVWSDDRTAATASRPGDAALVSALAGSVVSSVERGAAADDRRDAKLLEVYVPLRRRPGGPAEGAFEAYLPYGPVAGAVRDDTILVVAAVALGLLVLCASLFRLVARASRRLRRQALHDALTGLPNRTLLHREGARALSAARRRGTPAALLLIDLDRFKEVNDTLGHDHGDELLVEVTERLRAALRSQDLLARLGGDEFAVLLPDVPHRGAVAEVASRLHRALEDPFALRGVALSLEASIGVAIHPDDGRDLTTLLRRADVAMYEAKQCGTRIESYAAERDPYSPERLALLAELRQAIDRDELVLHYQPKVSLVHGGVIGVEALVRWNHPIRGELPPGEFLPLAERTGLIADLTRWVVRTALEQCRAWRADGVELPVAVNLAAANIVDGTLPDSIATLLKVHGLPGACLECEISEHTVMSDPRRAGEVLARLRDLGVRLSLDDFGTGQSSLSYLKRLPLDEVKIDRSFVMGMARDEGDAAIVRSTIDLARHLGLAVVAEGVETAEVYDDLAQLRCDVAQGFYLSRPMPGDAVRAWVAARRVEA
ncbi:MAG TPA: EAL domain-containing protein, partial [Solirubrobacteraceae bacterium]|nr:EAL domain-containing protein [Solirubrobacteraceae bacterium]